jgi:hypothetical protein
MTKLFASGELRQFLEGLLESASKMIESRSEDELLSRSTDDLVGELTPIAHVEPLAIGAEPVDGSVKETTFDVSRDFGWGGGRARGFEVRAVYEFVGDSRLFKYQPSQYQLVTYDAEVGRGTVTIAVVWPGLEIQPDQVKTALSPAIRGISRMADFASADARTHNERVPGRIRYMVDERKDRVMKRRDLAGALGFPLTRRADAPRPVPLERKPIGSARVRTVRETYRDEPALTAAQFEDAIGVVQSTLLAMERTPSVASGKEEEELRDQILVQLNGTFTGGATGETFVQKGKTDILVMDGDRHVFVGECKWWTGSKAFSSAIDQLLSYLPWRDEKAALVLFVDRKDATAVLIKADAAVRAHATFKRVGRSSDDASWRRNFVLGHPDDSEREIQLAVLFAVLPKEGRAGPLGP